MLRTLAAALNANGYLFASFKRGEGDTIDDLGRRFTNFETSALATLLSGCEFVIDRLWEEPGPALSGATTWVYVLARRT